MSFPSFDFHCHSNYSDGLLAPHDLMDYAAERNIEWLALTDHDCVDGIEEAQTYITQHDLAMRLIPGVEISALSEYGEVHIVGLNVDIQNQEFRQGLEIQQQKRWDRATLICERLNKAGVPDILTLCRTRVKTVITRTHIAHAIVEAGYAKDMQQAFKKYIGKNARINIPKDWMSVADAIGLIQSAGGFAVLAHPTRYPLTNRKLSYLIQHFAECKGDGLELAYPSLTPDKMNWLKLQLETNHLKASSGSDFHYPNLRWTDLGRFPRLDPKIPHLIELLNESKMQ